MQTRCVRRVVHVMAHTKIKNKNKIVLIDSRGRSVKTRGLLQYNIQD